MKIFTGFQYLLIDVANHYGLDKLTFEERIQWAEDHLGNLENMAVDAEAKPLFLKACMAIREAQAGLASGHMVAMDAVCSGIQIMSALTGCENGARATGMVDPDRRADAYTEVTNATNNRLQTAGLSGVSLPRKDVKYAVMTSVYGSKAVPKRLFGEDTPELECFYQGCFDVAPGAFELLNELLETWEPYALSHEWVLPDNFHAKVKVMEVIEKEGIEIDELNHHTFTYQYRVNQGQEKGLSNVANVVHSIDAYVLRSLVRRCDYDPEQVEQVQQVITTELLYRSMYQATQKNGPLVDNPELLTYVRRFNCTHMADVVILPLLDEYTVTGLDSNHLRALNQVLCQMLDRAPCHVITVHDSFAGHPNHVDTIRYWYRELMAELAESTILDDIFHQLVGQTGTYVKKSKGLATKIRQSNYALC